jgi:hypothetical protein
VNTHAIETQELVQLLQHLSPAEQSVLVATLETPDSQIATIKDTPNDALWSKLVELGLAQEMTLELDLPAALRHIQPRAFALTPLGRTKLPELLPVGRLS